MAAANRAGSVDRYRRQGAWIGAASHAWTPGRSRLQDCQDQHAMKPSRYATTLRAQCKPPLMTKILEYRIETLDAANCVGVGWYKDRGAYHLYLLDTEAPIARL